VDWGADQCLVEGTRAGQREGGGVVEHDNVVYIPSINEDFFGVVEFIIYGRCMISTG
jgi:hypothetical protein